MKLVTLLALAASLTFPKTHAAPTDDGFDAYRAAKELAAIRGVPLVTYVDRDAVQVPDCIACRCAPIGTMQSGEVWLSWYDAAGEHVGVKLDDSKSVLHAVYCVLHPEPKEVPLPPQRASFRGYHAGHDCPDCDNWVYTGRKMGNGFHTHACSCGAVWWHKDQ